MTNDALREREAVVAHLRRIANERYQFGDDDGEGMLSWIADDIERGDHLKDTHP